MARSGNNSRIPVIGQYSQASAPTFGTDLSELANDVANVIDPSVTAVGDLPASGNWTGRTIFVSTADDLYIWDGSDWGALGTADSGWVNITTFGTGWSATAGHQPRVRRIGKRVTLFGAVTYAPGGSASDLATIPAGFRPTGANAQAFVGSGMTNKGNGYVLFIPTADLSKITIPVGYATAGFSAPEVVPFIGSWFID